MVDRGKLISLVRDKATLWDQRDKFYHNRDFRSKLWEEVAKELNVQGTNGGRVQKSSSMEEEDEDLSFFKSLLPALKKLPYLRKMKLKASIFNSVIAELEAEERCNRPYQSVNTPLSSPQSGNFGGYNLNNPYASTSRPTTPHTETWPTPNDQIQTPPYTNTFENL
ncbi:hypothetical protein J6590_049256 [Homalodisca vitripennis]|nr:hypothetical protein J6590_049256 [Homalodisca vitripennis]